MNEWNEAIQQMIDWLEEHLIDNPKLLDMSKQIGYSPYYCSSQFHRVVGKTLKSYIAGRRLCRAALEIRDTNTRILDIAVKYGFSSQQALSRAFADAYGISPAAYRKNPSPVPFSPKKAVLFPEYYIDYYQKKGEPTMNKTILTKPNIRVEYIPAHKFIGIWDDKADNYFAFWEHRNCDELCGILESMSHVMHPVLPCHTGGWFWQDGKRGYCYGMGVPLDYSGEVPDGFELRTFPESYYLVFYHPTFDYLKDCGEVVSRVEKLAWNYNPADSGFAWNETDCQDYQRHMPETIGYEVLRPVRK